MPIGDRQDRGPVVGDRPLDRVLLVTGRQVTVADDVVLHQIQQIGGGLPAPSPGRLPQRDRRDPAPHPATNSGSRISSPPAITLRANGSSSRPIRVVEVNGDLAQRPPGRLDVLTGLLTTAASRGRVIRRSSDAVCTVRRSAGIQVVQQNLEQLLHHIGGRSVREIEVGVPGQSLDGQLQRQRVAASEPPGPFGGLCGQAAPIDQRGGVGLGQLADRQLGDQRPPPRRGPPGHVSLSAADQHGGRGVRQRRQQFIDAANRPAGSAARSRQRPAHPRPRPRGPRRPGPPT